MEQQLPWEQLARYFAGELSGEEEREIVSWIKADPKRKELLKKLNAIWRESGELPYRLDEDEAWENLSKNMDELENMHKLEKKAHSVGQRDFIHAGQPSVLHNNLRSKTNRTRKNTVRWAIMSAAAAVLLIVGLYSYYGSSGTSEEADIGIRELVAKKGERATYVLNDSTRIMLHAGSRLEVPLNFNIDQRELYLEGEAYFEVTHDPDKPFIVRSREAYTRVLGTKFLVQAWSGKDDHLEVVVSEGKVAFGNNSSGDTDKSEEAVVSRNQKGVLSGKETPVVTDNVDLEWYLGWTQDRLFFDNRPLSEIIPRLERWYDIDIKTVNKKITSKKLTAEIDVSQSMGEVMRNMALSLDLNIEREGRTVRFGDKE